MMAELPTGTITFLFTDIQGSTALWEHYPEASRTALEHHDTLIEAIVEQHRGMIVRPRGEGDSRFAVFPRATDGVLAACAIHHALLREHWPLPTPLRVRIAVHTGEADLRAGDYYGAAVNRCARLRAVAYGGQTLISRATQELVRDHLPPEIGLRDLGEHRLKDLIHPEHIFQVIAPELPTDFPPPKSLDARRHNLPTQPTLLVGREHEVAAAVELLRRPEVRLLTLTGPGGTGKTRLSLQVAAELIDDFGDGVWFIPIANVFHPNLVITTIARTLGVVESGVQSVEDSLKDWLRDKRLLLVLDNFEQVVAAAPVVAELLAATSELKVLVTSRIVLRIAAEHEFPVPPLRLPHPQHLPPLEQLTEYAAVRLFIERAQAVKPDFQVTNANAPAVAEICHRLDGLPLAIELAAARSKLLAPQALLARLNRRLTLLTGGARDLPARQQTLRNTIDWSYSLLDEAEQRLFIRLAVFMGGCTLEAVEAICNADDLALDTFEGLASLVDKSLLRQMEGLNDEPRFVMLETINEYAGERLKQQGDRAVHRRHADYYVAFAEQAEAELAGAAQGTCLEQLESEHPNLRAALARALEHEDTELGLRLGAALWRFWKMRGHYTEGRRWLDAVLARSKEETSSRASALSGSGVLADMQGDYVRANELHQESLALRRKLGDKPGIAASLDNLGVVAQLQNDYVRAAILHEESLALSRELVDKRGMARALNNLGIVAQEQGDIVRMKVYYEESLRLRRELNDKWGIASSLNNLGFAALALGDTKEAQPLFEESLALSREIQDKGGIASSLSNLGGVALSQGDYPKARKYYREGLALFQELEDRYGIAECLEGLAAVDVAQATSPKALRRAVSLWGAAEALRSAIGAPLPVAERDAYERNIAAARGQLGEREFAVAQAEGRARPVDQMIADVLHGGSTSRGR